MKTLKKKKERKKERKDICWVGFIFFVVSWIHLCDESLFRTNETMNYVARYLITTVAGEVFLSFLLSFSAVINWNNFTLPEEEESFYATTNGRQELPLTPTTKLVRRASEFKG